MLTRNSIFESICFEEDGGVGGAAETTIAAEKVAPETEATPESEEASYQPHLYQAQAKGEFKVDPFFKDYTDITSLMTGLKESKTKISELETANTPIETPKEASEYKMLDNSLLDGVSFTEKEVADLQDIALAAGVTQEQFEGLAKKSVENKKARQAFIAERREASAKELQKVWPNEAEYKEGWARFNKATAGLEKMGVENVNKLFENPAYGDNAVLIRIVSEFGRFFNDDKLLDGSGSPAGQKQTGQLHYDNM